MQKRVLKLSFGDTRPGIHNTKFRNHDTECTYLRSPQIMLQYIMILYNSFIFIVELWHWHRTVILEIYLCFTFTGINFRGMLHHVCNVAYDENMCGPITTRKCRSTSFKAIFSKKTTTTRLKKPQNSDKLL